MKARRRVSPLPFTAFVKALGITFEAAQEVVFKVLFDGVEPRELEGAEREIAIEAFGEMDGPVLSLARDVAVMVKGARVGGSRFSALRVGQLGLGADLSGLAPGELAYCIFCGPDVRLSRQAFNYWAGEVQRTPPLRARVVGEVTKHGMTMRHPDGVHLVRYEVLPATRGGSAIRARSLIAVHFTEFAFVRDESSAVADVALFQAVRPRLIRGGQIIAESTPWIEAGLFHALDRDNWASPTTALVARCPTILMRSDPRVHAMVAAEELRDPENAAREYGAQFLGGGAGLFFDPSAISQCIDADRPLVVAAPPNAAVGVGVDLGLIANSSAGVVVARVADRFEVLEVLEVRPARGKPLRLSAVIGEHLAPMMKRHRATRFTADGHVREPAREWTAIEKIDIDDAPGGAEGKVETHLLVQQAIREGRLTMPRHSRLEAQLRAIVSKPLPGGGIRISSPRRADGSHGDVASAFVLAVHAASVASSASVDIGRIRNWRSQLHWGGGEGGRGFY